MDDHGDSRSMVGEGHPHHPTAVVCRSATVPHDVVLAGDVDVHEVERPIRGERQPERVVSVGILTELSKRLTRNRNVPGHWLSVLRVPGDGRVAEEAAHGVAAAGLVECHTCRKRQYARRAVDED